MAIQHPSLNPAAWADLLEVDGCALIEGDKVRVLLHPIAPPQQVEHSKALLITDHDRAVDEARSDLEQTDRGHDGWEQLAPVQPPSRSRLAALVHLVGRPRDRISELARPSGPAEPPRQRPVRQDRHRLVYKVDRLTRSLADFAKLVELFDQHSVSFVSVTHSSFTDRTLRSA